MSLFLGPLPMCNVKIEYNKFVMHKKRNLCHTKVKFYFFWHVIIYLLLRDNKNTSLWHNILNEVQNKILVLHEKYFCVETKRLTLHKKKSGVNKNKLMLHEKVLHVNKITWCCLKKYFMSAKTRWCWTKKVFCA